MEALEYLESAGLREASYSEGGMLDHIAKHCENYAKYKIASLTKENGELSKFCDDWRRLQEVTKESQDDLKKENNTLKENIIQVRVNLSDSLIGRISDLDRALVCDVLKDILNKQK